MTLDKNGIETQSQTGLESLTESASDQFERQLIKFCKEKAKANPAFLDEFRAFLKESN